MSQAWIDALRSGAHAQGAAEGVAATGIKGLYTVRRSRAGALTGPSRGVFYCLVGQGAKEADAGGQTWRIEAGGSMLVDARDAMLTRIVSATPGSPYLALAFRLDAQLLAELAVEMPCGAGTDAPSTEGEVADTAARMLRLLARPAAVQVLEQPLRREMHYWLPAGRHGPLLRSSAPATRHAGRIARAVELLRSEFRSPLAGERLARAAGMGLSAFYPAFRGVTSLSPLQFQKQLRLSEARRLLVAQRMRVSEAAYAVGYESVPHFVRDYRRAYGVTPGRDSALARPEPQE